MQVQLIDIQHTFEEQSMLFKVNNNHHQSIRKISIPVIILLSLIVIYGCNQTQSEDFVKLDAPLEEVLPKLTLVTPDEVDENGKPTEFTVGDAYSGTEEFSLGNGESHKFQYNFFKQHVVEGNRYIFAVVSYNWGGSGTFYYLSAIDKTTLKNVHSVLLGDRIGISSVSLTDRHTDNVSIIYMDRESGTSMSENPDKRVNRGFSMHDGKLGVAVMDKI